MHVQNIICNPVGIIWILRIADMFAGGGGGSKRLETYFTAKSIQECVLIPSPTRKEES